MCMLEIKWVADLYRAQVILVDFYQAQIIQQTLNEHRNIPEDPR
jgi:hypothetical protein